MREEQKNKALYTKRAFVIPREECRTGRFNITKIVRNPKYGVSKRIDRETATRQFMYVQLFERIASVIDDGREYLIRVSLAREPKEWHLTEESDLPLSNYLDTELVLTADVNLVHASDAQIGESITYTSYREDAAYGVPDGIAWEQEPWGWQRSA